MAGGSMIILIGGPYDGRRIRDAGLNPSRQIFLPVPIKELVAELLDYNEPMVPSSPAFRTAVYTFMPVAVMGPSQCKIYGYNGGAE
jgi:hypothetical protein